MLKKAVVRCKFKCCKCGCLVSIDESVFNGVFVEPKVCGCGSIKFSLLEKELDNYIVT